MIRKSDIVNNFKQSDYNNLPSKSSTQELNRNIITETSPKVNVKVKKFNDYDSQKIINDTSSQNTKNTYTNNFNNNYVNKKPEEIESNTVLNKISTIPNNKIGNSEEQPKKRILKLKKNPLNQHKQNIDSDTDHHHPINNKELNVNEVKNLEDDYTNKTFKDNSKNVKEETFEIENKSIKEKEIMNVEKKILKKKIILNVKNINSKDNSPNDLMSNSINKRFSFNDINEKSDFKNKLDKNFTPSNFVANNIEKNFEINFQNINLKSFNNSNNLNDNFLKNNNYSIENQEKNKNFINNDENFNNNFDLSHRNVNQNFSKQVNISQLNESPEVYNNEIKCLIKNPKLNGNPAKLMILIH